MAPTKKSASIKNESKSIKKVVKAGRASPKSIDKPAAARALPGNSLRLVVKVQTAEGWKRGLPPKAGFKKGTT